MKGQHVIYPNALSLSKKKTHYAIANREARVKPKTGFWSNLLGEVDDVFGSGPFTINDFYDKVGSSRGLTYKDSSELVRNAKKFGILQSVRIDV